MKTRRTPWAGLLLAGLLIIVAWGYAAAHSGQLTPRSFLPLVSKQQPLREVRGLWVTRFDWTDGVQPASKAKIKEIVQNAAAAGFNVIFFQVRGAADAYYTPGLEPWAQRVSGDQLGQPPDPLWDPLDFFIKKAHASGIQLHAYLNVYPVWDNCSPPPIHTSPEHFYHLLQGGEGTTPEGKLKGLQWDTGGNVHCSGYLRSTPASIFADDHFMAVAADLMGRYDLDGIHLDHIRYGAANTSCDPVSEYYYTEGGEWQSCPDPRTHSSYAAWQRQQVNGTVSKFYQLVKNRPDLLLSAAVWPIYQKKPEWGWGNVSQGYTDYYQDSKAWLQGGYIDSIMPMIYPASYGDCPYSGFWTLDVWRTLVADFQASSNGRFVIPGIGAGYCTFDEIANRIQAARDIGTAGHAIFSYSGLAAGDGGQGYFDDLAAGPYAQPALVPAITWHP